jgi:tRNA(Arg) A34 adenosine deaminase TadA
MKIRQNITAIIYDKRGSVLSVGQNSYIKTHPLQAKHAALVGLHDKIYLHAEMAAIVRCKDLSKAHKIVVMRLGKSGKELLAKPCAICQSAIEASGIEIVEYTTSR